jgi:hypothetical protein
VTRFFLPAPPAIKMAFFWPAGPLISGQTDSRQLSAKAIFLKLYFAKSLWVNHQNLIDSLIFKFFG